jgi:uncharacterized SAM-binding protein YcdF (DUF218 family)
MRPGLKAVLAAVASMVVVGALGAVLVTSPAGARLLLALVDAVGRAGSSQQFQDRQAIVLLGGRTARVHDAARLHKASGLPILITGKGTGDSGFRAESEKMQDILAREYRMETRGIETESVNTGENAAFSWCLWGHGGIRRVLLVTDLRHMLRARVAFSLAGFDVTPAPAQETRSPEKPLGVEDLLPSAAGIEAAMVPLKELGGAAALVIGRLRDGGPDCSPVTPPGKQP